MSPTIVRERGYSIMIYFNDHPPPHVHVLKDGNDARVQLQPLQVTNNRGYKRNELKIILNLVEQHIAFLMKTWDELHPPDINDIGDDDDYTTR